MNYSVCILAAGKGSRTQLDFNKVFFKFSDGTSVLDRSVNLFNADPDCKEIILVVAKHEQEYVEKLYQNLDKVKITIGGKTRQESVSHGLRLVCSEHVFIHDGARPYLNMEEVNKLKQTLSDYDACLLMAPSVDTVKIVENGFVKESLDRSLLYNAQTPQCFKTSLLKECHQKALEDQREATDDAQLVEWYSNTLIKVVTGNASNIKITNPGDLPK